MTCPLKSTSLYVPPSRSPTHMEAHMFSPSRSLCNPHLTDAHTPAARRWWSCGRSSPHLDVRPAVLWCWRAPFQSPGSAASVFVWSSYPPPTAGSAPPCSPDTPSTPGNGYRISSRSCSVTTKCKTTVRNRVKRVDTIWTCSMINALFCFPLQTLHLDFVLALLQLGLTHLILISCCLRILISWITSVIVGLEQKTAHLVSKRRVGHPWVMLQTRVGPGVSWPPDLIRKKLWLQWL